MKFLFIRKKVLNYAVAIIVGIITLLALYFVLGH